MTVFVDTSVWSLALRRDRPPDLPEIRRLRDALDEGRVVCTGLVLQELLQGFRKPKAHRQIVDRFSALPLVVPDRADHIRAAELRNRCRRKGIQAGTIDALLAQLCIRHKLMMLTTDRDFASIASVIPLTIWQPT
ncbi:MAG TPA: PIN domain-containing protein [Pseudohaliea sp.]|nr:PIN domain-containing protein [Pseudohaliea sp.]